MDDEALLELLRRKEEAAGAYVWGDLGTEREQSLREYYRLPYGNEEDGMSQIVSSDIQDTVEWILPSLLKIFTSTDKAVSFEPSRQEDVAGAEQATDTCNYVFYKQNDGFLVLYTAFKDMLTIRNCAVMWRAEDVETVSSRPFKQASPEMLTMLMQQAGEDAEIVEVNQEPVMVQGQDGRPIPLIGPDGPVLAYSGRIKATETKRVIKLDAFSPNDLLVEREWTSPLLADCPYVARMMRVTLSDLKQMGFKDVTADELRESQERNESGRLSRVDRQESGDEPEPNTDDDSLAEGMLRIEFVLADADGDGIAERLCVYRLAEKILKKETVSHVQIATGSPILNPHRWDGMSMADAVSDLQQQHTELLRQTFNNLYLTNNPRTKVLTDSNWSPKVNIDDLLDSRAGGVVRMTSVDAVQEMVTPFAAGASMPMFEYIQMMRENRTGVSRTSMGLNPDSLNNTATGRRIDMDASAQRVELIARIAAETLLKPIFAGILKLLTDGGMKALAFRLRNEFVEYDPNEWRDQYDMTINVGLGTGDKIAQQQSLTNIFQMQQAGLQYGYSSPQQLYHTATKLVENAGFKDVQNFVQDPSQQPPKPPQPDPEQMKAQAQMQLEQFKAQMQMQTDQLQRQHEAQLEQLKAQVQASVDQNRQEMEARQKTLEQEQLAQLEAVKIAQAERESERKDATERYKADVQAQTAIIVANTGAAKAAEGEAAGGDMSSAIAEMKEAITAIHEMSSAPREIVRGPDGRAMGVKIGNTVKTINRGPDGRVAGV